MPEAELLKESEGVGNEQVHIRVRVFHAESAGDTQEQKVFVLVELKLKCVHIYFLIFI